MSYKPYVAYKPYMFYKPYNSYKLYFPGGTPCNGL